MSETKALKKDFNHGWQKALTFFDEAAEVSNVGIIIEIVGKLVPFIVAAAGPMLHTIAYLTDPMIYVFRGLGLATKTAGRHLGGVEFEEDKYKAHPYQTTINFMRMALFAAAIPLFFGFFITPAIGLTVAWALSISSMTLAAHFNYGHNARMAQQHLDNLGKDVDPAYKEAVEKDVNKITNSYHLYIAVVVGIAFLFLCGSAAAFAPPELATLLENASKVASAYLAAVNIGRLLNSKGDAVLTKKVENNLKPEATPSTQLVMTEAIKLGYQPVLNVDCGDSELSNSADIIPAPSFNRYSSTSRFSFSDISSNKLEASIPEHEEENPVLISAYN